MVIPGWLTVVSWIFISIGLLSAALVLEDIYLLEYREHMRIMEAVWPLTALYAGPVAIAAYLRWGRPKAGQSMRAGGRDMGAKPFWAGTAVSATHRSAGCVLGDFIAEWVVFATGLRIAGFALPVEYPFDYVLALCWGSCSSTSSSCQCATSRLGRDSGSRLRRTSWRCPPSR